MSNERHRPRSGKYKYTCSTTCSGQYASVLCAIRVSIMVSNREKMQKMALVEALWRLWGRRARMFCRRGLHGSRDSPARGSSPRAKPQRLRWVGGGATADEARREVGRRRQHRDQRSRCSRSHECRTTMHRDSIVDSDPADRRVAMAASWPTAQLLSPQHCGATLVLM